MAITGLFTLRVIVPVAFLSFPASAEASILSLVTSLFSAQAAAAGKEIPDNSQKMALLEAPVNSNVRAGSHADVLIEGSALVPDMMGDATEIPVVNNEITTYKVAAGDTVSSVAKKYGVSSNTIIWANSLDRNAALKEGQNLVILPISGVQHKVKSGDTIKGIALKYKGDVDEIIAYNDLKGDTVKIGDIIVVPDGELQSSSATKKTTAPATTKKLASVAIGASEASISTSGYFMRPISGGVRTQGIHGNNGVDLADSCGASIYASAAGSVIVSKNNGAYNGGYGNYVVISHDNGTQTLYGHMEAVGVDLGAEVTKGQFIGTLGNTGKVYGATGCHVHFEVRGARNPF